MRYLARQGFEVVVVDRQNAPAMETSFANAGQVSPGYASPWAAPGVPLKASNGCCKARALAIKATADIDQYLWMAQMLRNCTASRYAVNKGAHGAPVRVQPRLPRRTAFETGIAYEGRSRAPPSCSAPRRNDNAAPDIAVLQQSGVPYEMLIARTLPVLSRPWRL